MQFHLFHLFYLSTMGLLDPERGGRQKLSRPLPALWELIKEGNKQIRGRYCVAGSMGKWNRHEFWGQKTWL